MLKTYDSTLKAYTEHLPKNHNASLNAWVESPSAKTFDTAQNAWVERLYSAWLPLYRKDIASVDTLEITPSKVYFDMPSNGYQNRTVAFILFEHDIKAGDVIEFDVNASYYASVNISIGYITDDGAHGSYIVFRKSEKTDAVNGHFSKTVESPNNFKQWGNFAISISFYYEGIVVGATVEIANLKVNGKKYGFTE